MTFTQLTIEEVELAEAIGKVILLANSCGEHAANLQEDGSKGTYGRLSQALHLVLGSEGVDYWLQTGEVSDQHTAPVIENAEDLRTCNHVHLIPFINAMRQHGGHFASSLGRAWSHADGTNSRTLQEAFYDLLWSYHRHIDE